MNMTRHTTSEIFAVAAREIVKRTMDRGQQKHLAKSMNIRPSYLSDLLAGRRNWSDRLRDKFVDVINVSITDLYAIGEEFLKTGTFFPHVGSVSKHPAHTIERAAFILELALHDFHLSNVGGATPEVLLAWKPATLEAYLKGQASDGALYDMLCAALKTLLKNYVLKK